MPVDTIVVGGGLAGLTAATLLARTGQRVIVLERSAHLGGRATSQTLGGALFNQGPRALCLNGAATRILADLGVSYAGGLSARDGRWVVRDGRLFPLPGGPIAILGSPAFTWAERLELIRAFVRLNTTRPESLHPTTLAHYLDGIASRPRVRAFILALIRVTTYTHAPEAVSAGAILQQVKHSLRDKVMYLDGGWQSLVDGLGAAAGRAGVTVRLQSAARSVAPGRVALDGGETLEAPNIVLAVPPQTAASLLGQAPAPATPVQAACLDVAIDKLPSAEHTFAMGLDAPHYFSVHSKYAQLGPAGVHVLHAMKYLPPGDRGHNARPELEALIDLLQPGWREHVLEQRYLPCMTVFHMALLAAEGGLSGRPSIAVLGQEGIYLAGDSVGSEGMLCDASFASAEAVASAILRSSGSGAHPKAA